MIERPSAARFRYLESAESRQPQRYSADREEVGGEPVAERDGPGLVEEERVHVAGCLHRAAAHRQDVLAQEPIHSRDADRGQEASDGGGDEADEQRDRRGRAGGCPE